MEANPMSPRIRSKNRIRVVYASDQRIVVMLPGGNGRRLLTVLARSVLIIMVVIALSALGSIQADYGTDLSVGFGSIDDYLPIFVRELYSRGLVRSGSRGVLIGEFAAAPLNLEDMEMDLVVYDSDDDFVRSIANDSVDFVFADSYVAAAAGGFIERVLKIGGIRAVRMSEDRADQFVVPVVPPNYEISCIHHFDATFVAMKKMGQAALLPPSAKRPLCGYVMDSRKAAMSGLEDVLLEPPRRNSLEVDQYVDETKYLPDLIGDLLDRYPRRVFIDVGLDRSGAGWFVQHYPTRGQVFEIFNVGSETEREGRLLIGISDWLGRNVREEEFVVVKAEEDVVVRMMKSKAICLVDELFLECNYQGQSGKAYWQCLALLGLLRSEGIAVHHWWG